MSHFTSGAATLFVEKPEVSFVEFNGPNASSGESGGPLCSLEKFVTDAEVHSWVKRRS
jgi:hypothetical protein